jgi:hypothetical protein
MTLAAGYGAAAAVVFVALALAHGHLVRRGPAPVPHLVALWLLVGALTAVVVALVAPGPALALAVTNTAVYLLLGEVYLFVYAVAVGSLSVQILVSMFELEPSPDAFARTLARHSPEAFFSIRLKSLTEQGLLHEERGRYRITERGRRWASVGVALKKVLAVGTGG